jgi:hypothetical protein
VKVVGQLEDAGGAGDRSVGWTYLVQIYNSSSSTVLASKDSGTVCTKSSG